MIVFQSVLLHEFLQSDNVLRGLRPIVLDLRERRGLFVEGLDAVVRGVLARDVL